MGLKKKLENALKRIEQLSQELAIVKQEKEALEKELNKYKNSNTPPSANQHLKPSVTKDIEVKTHKRGAPKGHPGTNRPKKECDEHRDILGCQCPNCLSKDFEVIGHEHQQIEEVPHETQPTVIDVTREVCRCKNCHLKFVATDKITPLKGKFGLNIIMLVILLRFIVRGVLRKTASFLESSFAFKLSPASIQKIIERVAVAGEIEYAALKERIRAACKLYIDETSFSVLGLNWWVWVFRSDTDLLLVVRKSRGNNVLEEILGKNYAGTVICDCWRAYDFLSFATIQRCWSHLLRKSAELCKSIAGRHFHDKLSLLFKEIKKFNNVERTTEQRARKYERMTLKLKNLISYYSRYPECESVVKYIDFHLESWFTCIKIEGIEPTNNFAEQAIRESVMVRKIIGAFRSVKGTKTYETLASLIATWQYRKLDIKKELYRMLSKNMC